MNDLSFALGAFTLLILPGPTNALLVMASHGLSRIGLLEVLAAVVFIAHGTRTRDWQPAYEQLRSNLGRGILLGLELLVGADIISTITAPLTIESVGLLGGIVVIRTFLSFSLETEILGCWPWQRAANNARSRDELAAPTARKG